MNVEDESNTLPQKRKIAYPLSPTIIHDGHDNPPVSSHDAIRTVEVNSDDPIVSRSGRLKVTAAMVSMATEATVRRRKTLTSTRMS